MINYTNVNQAAVASIITGLIQDGVNPFTDDYEFTVRGESYIVEHKKEGISLTHPENNDVDNTGAAIVAIMMLSAVSCITVNGKDVVYGININKGKSRKRLYLTLLALGVTALAGVLIYRRVTGEKA